MNIKTYINCVCTNWGLKNLSAVSVREEVHERIESGLKSCLKKLPDRYPAAACLLIRGKFSRFVVNRPWGDNGDPQIRRLVISWVNPIKQPFYA